MRLSPLLVVALAACGGIQRPLAAQVATGSANGPPGGILVFSSRCANLMMHCPMTWSPAVDAIVTSGLSFHGFQTIDPTHLRTDEARRTETTNDESSRTATTSRESGVEATSVILIPIVTFHKSNGATVVVHESREKTVVLEGATLEDLTIPDRRALMEMAGATSLLSTQITVGANWSTWSTRQIVEVMVKLSDAASGEMRWSARCAASSGDFPSAAAALEAAAHCVVDSLDASGVKASAPR